MTPAAAIRPWYREPWPWFLLGVPLATIVAGAITMTIAMHGADGVVAADYYKRGLEIGMEAGRQQRADALGLGADVRWDGVASGDAVTVTVLGNVPEPAPATLRLRLVHPAHAAGDRVALLARVGADARGVRYAGAWAPGAEGAPPQVAAVVLATEDWRLDGRWQGGAAGVQLGMTSR